MSKVVKTRRLDTAAAEKQFKDDMAKMAVTQPGPGGAPVPVALKQRLRGRLHVRGFTRKEWEMDLGPEQSLQDAAEPSFWRDVAAQIMGHDPLNPAGRGDLIHVFKMDAGLYAKLLVIEVGAGYVKTIPVEVAAPAPVEMPENIPFTTRWNAGKRGHEVLRKADDQVMAGPFQTKTTALAWIADHMRKMAA